MSDFLIGSEPLSLSILRKIDKKHLKLTLSDQSKTAILRCREYLEHKLVKSPDPIYGINTGFGYLQNVVITDDKLSQLQHNILLSHACGTGNLVPQELVKLMLLFKIQSLSYGHSGIRLQTIERLILQSDTNIW